MSKTSDEAMARLEHKMDVVLDLVMEMMGRFHGIRANAIPRMGDNSHTCPICKEYVKYVVDMQERSVTAQCGCKTGKYAPLDLEQFAPPQAAGGRNGAGEGSGFDASGEGEPSPREQQRPPGSRRG